MSWKVGPWLRQRPEGRLGVAGDRGNIVAKLFRYLTLRVAMDESMPAAELAWTGERLVTTCHRPIVYEHLHRYALAFGLAKRKRVLDIACGEGYGANLLARTASKVIGVDLDAGTIAHAKAKYRRRNLHFVQGSCTEIPCEDHSIDLVASFETIEHISEHDAFLSEIKRVLVPEGILIISSPHKAEYQKVSEPNPFHEAELDHDEFVRLIAKTFKYRITAKQRLVVGSWVAPDAPSANVSTATFRGGFDGIEIESGVYRGLYSIAICSDATLPKLDLGVFEDFRDSADAWNLLDVYDTPAQLSARLTELTQVGDQQAKQVLHLQNEAREKSEHIVQLQRDVEGKSQQVARFQREIEERSKDIVQLQAELEEKSRLAGVFKAEAEERSKSIARLQGESVRRSQLLERLKDELEAANERVTLAKDELIDARWEALTLRGTLLNKKYTLLAYYTGHGILSSEDYQLYLATHETSKRDLEIEAVSIEDFKRYIRRSTAGRKL